MVEPCAGVGLIKRGLSLQLPDTTGVCTKNYKYNYFSTNFNIKIKPYFKNMQ